MLSWGFVQAGFDVLMLGLVMILRWGTIRQFSKAFAAEAKKIRNNGWILVGIGVVGILIAVFVIPNIQVWSGEASKILQVGVGVGLLGAVELMASAVVKGQITPNRFSTLTKVVTYLGGALIVFGVILLICGK